jgi:hypothetical protein
MEEEQEVDTEVWIVESWKQESGSGFRRQVQRAQKCQEEKRKVQTGERAFQGQGRHFQKVNPKRKRSK